jgi:hypothetical protein
MPKQKRIPERLYTALIAPTDILRGIPHRQQIMNVGNLRSSVMFSKMPGNMGGLGDVPVVTDTNGTMWDVYGNIVDATGNILYTAQQAVNTSGMVLPTDAMYQAVGYSSGPTWPQPQGPQAVAPLTGSTGASSPLVGTSAPVVLATVATNPSLLQTINSIFGMTTGATQQQTNATAASSIAASQSAAMVASSSNTTMMLLAAAGVGAFLLLRKKN